MSITLHLSREELGQYSNVLNEILNGFEPKISRGGTAASREDTQMLLERLGDFYKDTADGGKKLVQLSAEEQRTLRAAFLACIQELGEEEIETRTGLTMGEASSSLHRLGGS